MTVRPVDGSTFAAELAPNNPFFGHGEAQAFASDAGHVVASIDRRRPDLTTGTVGFFECRDDVDAARALFDAAFAWLRHRGCTRVEGPVNLHVLYGYRLQISGAERRPFALEPRNPAYYPKLFEAAGFAPSAWWRTWDISGLALTAFKAFHKIKSGNIKRLADAGYSRRPFDLSRWDDELRALHHITFASYAKNWGFFAMDFDEYAAIHAPLRHLAGVRGCFLLHGAEPVGFGFAIDDNPVGILHSFGILPEHRGKGLAHFIYDEAFEGMKTVRIDTLIGALAKEGTATYSKLGKPHRRYAVYARDLP